MTEVYNHGVKHLPAPKRENEVVRKKKKNEVIDIEKEVSMDTQFIFIS